MEIRGGVDAHKIRCHLPSEASDIGSRPLVVYGVRSEIPMNPITVLLQSYNVLLSRVKVVHAAADVAR